MDWRSGIQGHGKQERSSGKPAARGWGGPLCEGKLEAAADPRSAEVRYPKESPILAVVPFQKPPPVG
jgi:hypothetical protein